jgi:hypothetical protein
MSDLDQMYPSLKKGFVKDYTDLLAYRTSFQLSKEIFESTKRFPKEETYELTDQFRRAIGRPLNGMIERSSAFVIRDDRVQEDPAINDFFSRFETE